jgi:hypothetical protein
MSVHRKPKWIPCSVERTYSPPEALPKQVAPTDSKLVRLDDYFKAYGDEWFDDDSKPADSVLLHVSPAPQEKAAQGQGPSGGRATSRSTRRGGGNAPSRSAT